MQLGLRLLCFSAILNFAIISPVWADVPKEIPPDAEKESSKFEEPPMDAEENAPIEPSQEVAPEAFPEDSKENQAQETNAAPPENHKKEPQETEPGKICHCQFRSDVPYTQRRTTFGGLFGVQAGTYDPVKYKPAFSTQNWSSLYESGKTPNIEVAFGALWNFFLGSLGLHMTGGIFTATNNTSNVTSTLTIFPVTGGIYYSLDNIFKEPYVAPYVIVGAYTGIYSESVQGLSVKGNTPFSPFYAAGLNFQLDWLDEEAHDVAYKDYGLENTFLYVEARSFLPANNNVPDLSTPLQMSGGLRVEF